jgi:SAM-dependent methyltransferase
MVPKPMSSTNTTRASWDVATRNHNAHKGDQAAALRAGAEILFPEELELLGPLADRSLVHLQCNAGQDTLCLARRAARVVGVDFSEVAVTFARELSRDAGIPARFELAEVVEWMHATDGRFDVAFSSYGVVGWLPDLAAWAEGVARVLVPGGRFVYVDFHPVVWSIGDSFKVDRDDYFARDPFVDPVGDYVAASGDALGAIDAAPAALPNPVAAQSWQYGLAQTIDALVTSGLRLTTLREYPYANGCRVHAGLVRDEGDARRWVWPPGIARTPLMFGLVVERPR